MPNNEQEINRSVRQVESDHIENARETLWYYFLFFYLILFILYFFFMHISKNRFYGVLIPLDFILTFTFAFSIIIKDLKVLNKYKCDILKANHIDADGQTRVPPEHLIVQFVFILIGLVFFAVIFLLTTPVQSQGVAITHNGIKLFKFVISQVIMVGAIFVISKIYGMILIGTLTDDFKVIMHKNLVNIVNKGG